MPEQMEFPSLAFPKDRRMLYCQEVAARLRCTVQHVHDLIDEGKIRAINISGGDNQSDRRALRIPVESWEKFIARNTI